MREILFKGFCKDENGKEKIFLNGEEIIGEWIEGYYNQSRISNGKRVTEIRELAQSEPTYQMFTEVIPETVSEYIGENDINGKKIFDGNILAVKIYSCNLKNQIAEGIGIVEYRNTGFGVVWGSHKEFVRFDGFCNTTFEVIGNIYEDLELIQEG